MGEVESNVTNWDFLYTENLGKILLVRIFRKTYVTLTQFCRSNEMQEKSRSLIVNWNCNNYKNRTKLGKTQWDRMRQVMSWSHFVWTSSNKIFNRLWIFFEEFYISEMWNYTWKINFHLCFTIVEEVCMKVGGVLFSPTTLNLVSSRMLGPFATI